MRQKVNVKVNIEVDVDFEDWDEFKRDCWEDARDALIRVGHITNATFVIPPTGEAIEGELVY